MAKEVDKTPIQYSFDIPGGKLVVTREDGTVVTSDPDLAEGLATAKEKRLADEMRRRKLKRKGGLPPEDNRHSRFRL